MNESSKIFSYLAVYNAQIEDDPVRILYSAL